MCREGARRSGCRSHHRDPVRRAARRRFNSIFLQSLHRRTRQCSRHANRPRDRPRIPHAARLTAIAVDLVTVVTLLAFGADLIAALERAIATVTDLVRASHGRPSMGSRMFQIPSASLHALIVHGFPSSKDGSTSRPHARALQARLPSQGRRPGLRRPRRRRARARHCRARATIVKSATARPRATAVSIPFLASATGDPGAASSFAIVVCARRMFPSRSRAQPERRAHACEIAAMTTSRTACGPSGSSTVARRAAGAGASAAPTTSHGITSVDTHRGDESIGA